MPYQRAVRGGGPSAALVWVEAKCDLQAVRITGPGPAAEVVGEGESLPKPGTPVITANFSAWRVVLGQSPQSQMS